MSPLSTAPTRPVPSERIAAVPRHGSSATPQPGPVQNLKEFRVPARFRGRPAWVVQLWWMVQATLFRASPQVLYGWGRFLLRLFGGSVGEGWLVLFTAR